MRKTMNRIILAGCLAFIYLQFGGGGHWVKFLQSVGATEFHFGVFGAVPPGMLLMQFVGALIAARLKRKKRVWITLMVLHRALVFPIAALPWIFPDASPLALVWGMIAMTVLSQGLSNLGVPMWFSWMGDLLPRKSLNEFWARRSRWMALTNGVTVLFAAIFFWHFQDVDIKITYLIMGMLAALAGIWDILLFVKVPERAVASSEDTNAGMLVAPFKDVEFRGFIFYSGYLTFACMFAAPFFQLYLLKSIGLPLFSVMLLFFFHAIGGALFARHFGVVADKRGQRPVMVLCTALKPLIAIGFFLVQPGYWVLGLVPILLIDNMMDTGLMVSRSGYMLKQSPKDQRAMYVASTLACCGLGGALGSFLGGVVLDASTGFGADLGFMVLNHFHIVFGISILLRLSCTVLAGCIREKDSHSPKTVWIEVVEPALSSWLRFPIGFLSRRDG